MKVEPEMETRKKIKRRNENADGQEEENQTEKIPKIKIETTKNHGKRKEKRNYE
jgi:hypothetical protein